MEQGKLDFGSEWEDWAEKEAREEWKKNVLNTDSETLTKCLKRAEEACIPSFIKEIAENAFEGCNHLVSIKSESPHFTAENGSLFASSTKKLITTVSGNVEIPAVIRSLTQYSLCNATSVSFEKGGKLKTIPKDLIASDEIKAALEGEIAKNKAKGEKVTQVKSASADAMMKSLISASGADVEAWSEKGRQVLGVKKEDIGIEIRFLNSNVSSWIKTLPDFLEFTKTAKTFDEILQYALSHKMDIADKTATKYGVFLTDASSKRDKFFVAASRWGWEPYKSNYKGEKTLETAYIANITTRWNFSQTHLLKTAMIAEGIETIGSAFCFCASLEKVILPKSIKQIRKEAFCGCPAISVIDFAGTVSQWQAIEKEEGWIDEAHSWVDRISTPCIVKCSDGEMKVREAHDNRIIKFG